MSTVQVKNSLTNTKAAKRTRYEKLEVAYGKIPAAAYAVGDTLSFDHSPVKSLVHAKFTANGHALEVFHGADLSSALAFDILNSSSTSDISYVISYIKGTGHVNAAGTFAGDGERIQLTIASS